MCALTIMSLSTRTGGLLVIRVRWPIINVQTDCFSSSPLSESESDSEIL